jgi:hypothetical protein
VVLAASAAVLLAGAVVAVQMRHDRTESRLPSPPASANESATTASPPPAIPGALAPIATATATAAPSAEQPIAVKAVAPPVPAVPAAKPTRAKTVPSPELSAKPSAMAEASVVASAPPEPPAAPPQAPAAAPSPPAPSEPPAAVATPPPVAAPAPPRLDVTQAKVLVQPAVRVSGATAGSVNRAVASAAVPLTACYRAALPQLSAPLDGEATLHIETDGAGTITDARFAGPLGSAVQACAASALIGRRIANVDTGSASADIPLVFKAR